MGVKIAEAFVEFVGRKSPLMKVIDEIKEKTSQAAAAAGLKGSKAATVAWQQTAQKAKNASVAAAAAAKAGAGTAAEAISETAVAAGGAEAAAGGAAAMIGGPFTLALAGLAAAGYTATRVLGEVKSAADELKDLEVVARSTGQAASELTALDYALRRAGTDLGSFLTLRDGWNASILDIQFGAGRAGAALRILGVRATDEAGNLRELRDVLPELNKAMEGFSTLDQRRLASGLFGGGADAYMRALKAGPSSLDDSAKNARALNLVTNDASVRAGAQLSDSWGTMMDELKALWRNVTAALSPILTPLTSLVTVVLSSINQALSVFNAVVIRPITWVFSKVYEVFTWMNRQADKLARRFSWIKAVRDFFYGSTDAPEKASSKLGRGQLDALTGGGYKANLTGLADFARTMLVTAAGRSNIGERQFAELQKHTQLLGQIAGSPIGAPTFAP